MTSKAINNKINFLGGVEKEKTESVAIHFVNSNDTTRGTRMKGTFLDDLHMNIDLETTTKTLVPKILSTLGMPEICRDIFNLYVYWDDLPPRPLGPNELVLPALVWQNPIKRSQKLIKSIARKRGSDNLGSMGSGGVGGRGMTFTAKRSVSRMMHKRTNSRFSTYQELRESFNAEVGVEEGNNDEEDDEQYRDVKLVFKLRLFVNVCINSIDECGTSREIGRFHSKFRMLLCLQIEKYISFQKWYIQEDFDNTDDELLKLIGVALGVKFGGINFLKDDVDIDGCVTWTKEVYGNVYYSKVGSDIKDDAVLSYWRSAEQNLKPSQTYDQLYLESCRRLLGSYFGCELFEVLLQSNTGKAILVGVNETGLLFFDRESKVLERVFPLEYISTWGHVVQDHFYFRNSGGPEEDIKLYTKEASYLSGLLREYAVVILNVEEGRYVPTGLKHSKKKAVRGLAKVKKNTTFLHVTKLKMMKAAKGKGLEVEKAGNGNVAPLVRPTAMQQLQETQWKAASRIQSWMRSYLVRNRFKKLSASLVIQTFGRVAVAKTALREEKRKERALSDEMTKNLIWKREQEKRRKREEAEKMERELAERKMRVVTERRKKEERRRVEEEETRKREEEEKKLGSAVASIQSRYRGGKLRSQILKMEEELEEKEKMDQAAIAIQSNFRGGKLRSDIMKMAEDVEEEVVVEEE